MYIHPIDKFAYIEDRTRHDQLFVVLASRGKEELHSIVWTMSEQHEHAAPGRTDPSAAAQCLLEIVDRLFVELVRNELRAEVVPLGRLTEHGCEFARKEASFVADRTRHTVGVVALLVVIMVMLLVYRWRNGQPLLCCDILRARTREARRQQKQSDDRNPAVIESVVTHGANMNVPSNLHQNYAYANENTASTKRKLFNPMFDDSPRADNRRSQNETSFRNHHSTSAYR